MDIVSEEKIWLAYETEVIYKLPNIGKDYKIPLKLFKRIAKRWVSVGDILKWLREKEEAAKDRYATGEAYTYKTLREEIEKELAASISVKQKVRN